MKLLDAVTEDTTGSGVALGDFGRRPYREYMFFTNSSNYGSGTVTLQVSFDEGTTWVPTAVAHTANLATPTSIRATHVRAVLTGSTTPAALTAVLL